jgi:hypothetical protein
MNNPSLALFALWVVAVAGCVTRRASSGDPHAAHRRAAAVVVAPSPAGTARADVLLRVPLYASVLWQNDTAGEVVVDVVGGTCNGCDTVVGFLPSEGGAKAAAMPAGGAVSLCFHTAGRFPFVVRSAGGEVLSRGVVAVGEPVEAGRR